MQDVGHKMIRQGERYPVFALDDGSKGRT